jgi:hypothetical protein
MPLRRRYLLLLSGALLLVSAAIPSEFAFGVRRSQWVIEPPLADLRIFQLLADRGVRLLRNIAVQQGTFKSRQNLLGIALRF